MTRTHTSTAALTAVLAAVAGGCATPTDPYADATTKAPAPAPAAPERSPELEAPDDLVVAPSAPVDPSQGQPAATPQLAARRYATAYVNWTSKSYAKQQRQLQQLAGGRLREDLARSQPGTDQLAVLKDQKQTNRGRVLSVGAPARPARSGSGRELYVLTLEHAGSGGFEDPNERHEAYKATATPTRRGGWLISAWSALP